MFISNLFLIFIDSLLWYYIKYTVNIELKIKVNIIIRMFINNREKIKRYYINIKIIIKKYSYLFYI